MRLENVKPLSTAADLPPLELLRSFEAAARTLGARGGQAFWRVYFRLSLPGVAAAGLLVFITALGFFITPALMGGPGDIMIAMLIEREIELTQNWPTAALMTLVLLAVTLTLYAVYQRFSGQAEVIAP